MTALSLILPCFNEAERLPATLATYLAQPGTRGQDSEAPLTRQVASRAFNVALHLLSDLPFTGHPSGERAYAQ